MANSCVATLQSSATLHTSIVDHHQRHFSPRFLSLPFKPLSSRVLKAKAKAVYPDGFVTPPNNERSGLWSIREDLAIPSSPYFPAYAQGQGPPPMVAERFQSVITQLFQYRIIRCGGAVDDDMANIIVAQLLYLDAVDPTKDIVMYVNSPGGSVTAGMAIFDTMRHIRPDVSTVCVGLAASVGCAYEMRSAWVAPPWPSFQLLIDDKTIDDGVSLNGAPSHPVAPDMRRISGSCTVDSRALSNYVALEMGCDQQEVSDWMTDEGASSDLVILTRFSVKLMGLA